MVGETPGQRGNGTGTVRRMLRPHICGATVAGDGLDHTERSDEGTTPSAPPLC